MTDFRGVLAGFRATADARPGTIAVRILDDNDVAATMTYRQLYEGARRAGAGLRRLGIARGERIVVALPTCGEFFCLYLGCLMAGIVPAVVGPPRGQAGGDGATDLGSIARAIAARYVVVRDLPIGATANATTPLVDARSLLAHASDDIASDNDADGIAHLQGTSGTTSTPRWAIVRHRNIAANVTAIADVIGHRTEDVLVTWLPMSHDMGLIGLSYAWFWGIPLVAADPSNFVRNPLTWLELISRYGGTLSPAPNSAFQACARIAKLRPPKTLDLSRWRVALCGAEPVRAATLHDFHLAFGRFGLRREALRPVYGLAEATLAVTLSAPKQPFRTEQVAAESCAPGATVVVAGEHRSNEVTVVGCGRVIPKHELRIVDADGRSVNDGVVGEIEFRGDSVIDGYLGSTGDAGLKRGDFLRTGDLGYLRDGELFVTGRAKEILIVNGRNFSPLQIEATLEHALGAAFTPAAVPLEAFDEQLQSGALHILLDGRLRPGKGVEARVRQVLDDVFALRGVTLHWVAGGNIPRTTSGKIQRFRCRELVAPGARAELSQQYHRTEPGTGNAAPPDAAAAGAAGLVKALP